MYNRIVDKILFFHCSTSLLEYFRQIDRHIINVIIFWKKQYVKNESSTIFWLVESRNWFMIHELQTLNSISGTFVSPEKIFVSEVFIDNFI